MRCIFCKQGSESSKSVEHIIPESLGNTKQILPKGIVCDVCNNYFARKIEKPFLDSPSVVALRSNQVIVNKRGKVPSTSGIIVPKLDDVKSLNLDEIASTGSPVLIHRHPQEVIKASVSVDVETYQRLIQVGSASIVFSVGDEINDNIYASRFLAKVALEAMAQKVLAHPGHASIDQLIDDVQLDPIRNHARRGNHADWHYHSRRIYDAHKNWDTADGPGDQVIYEYDFLMTEKQELYFVLALFGWELTINLGGPSTDGFIDWLIINSRKSPLHCSKNKNVFF